MALLFSDLLEAADPRSRGKSNCRRVRAGEVLLSKSGIGIPIVAIVMSAKIDHSRPRKLTGQL